MIYQLFRILEENNLIKKGIWPQKREYGNKSKIVNYKNLAKKLFTQKTNIGNCLDNLKVLAYYRIVVKNRLFKLKKRFKTIE